MKKKLIIIGVVVLIFAAIAYKLTANKKIINENKKVENKTVVIPVTTMTTAFTEVSHKMIKSGTLIPFTEADITSLSPGELTNVNFELGDYFSKGEVLATLDNEALKLNLKAAQLTEEKAEKDYKRLKALLEGNATTTINFQDAKYKYENAKNKIKQIKKQISDNLIKAPISGKIVTKTKEPGEYVSPGTVLGHIVDVRHLKVDVMVSEQDVYKLEENSPVKVTTDIYPGITFNGKIAFISPKGDAVHNYRVEVVLGNQSKHPLKAGSFAYVDFEQSSKKQQILIPKRALIKSLDKPMVYVIKKGKAIVKKITVGDTYGNKIAVINGLKTGEQVITSGLVNISEGTPVKSVKK